MNEPTIVWRKSSFSEGQGGNCVEVATLPGGRIAVRDSKNPHGATLTCTAEAWQAFLTGVRNTEFDSMPG